MTEKYSLSLYVSVFQSVVKVGRFSAYRYSVHAAARLRKVMLKGRKILTFGRWEEDGEVE